MDYQRDENGDIVAETDEEKMQVLADAVVCLLECIYGGHGDGSDIRFAEQALEAAGFGLPD